MTTIDTTRPKAKPINPWHVPAGQSVPFAAKTVTPDELLTMQHRLRPPNRYKPSPEKLDKIIGAACLVCGVTIDDLASKSRREAVVMAREIIAVLGHRETTFSYPELARAIGRPNHSTMITAANRHEKRRDESYTIGNASMTRYGWMMAAKQEAGLA